MSFTAALLSNYTDPSSVPREICEKIANVLRNSFYRGIQFLNLVESVAATIFILYTFCKYRKNLSFHLNIKILLWTLYLLCFFHAVFYSIAKVYQLEKSFFTIEPCELFLPANFYLITNFVIRFCNTGIMFTQAGMLIERIVATILVDSYEKHCRALGITLIFLVAVINSLATVNDLHNIAGNHLMTNSMIHTQSESSDLTITFAALLLFNCLLLATNILLFCFNARRRKRRTLTSRYQNVENVSTSALLCIISVIQSVTFSLYSFSMAFLRWKANENPLVDAYKEAAYLVPLATLLIPFGIIFFIEISRKNRRNGISDMLKMETSGQEGWQKHVEILNRVWN